MPNVAAPRVPTYVGSFEDARAKAFRDRKLLVVHVQSAQRCAVADRLFELALSSEEMVSLLSDNCMFWQGSVTALRATHAQMLAPNGYPSVCMVLPLAVDAMRVLSILPVASKEILASAFVQGLEALQVHLDSTEARLFSEEAILRREQEEEFAAALIADQEAERVKEATGQLHASVADADMPTEEPHGATEMDVDSPTGDPCETHEDLQQRDMVRRELAEKFKALPSPTGLTSRLMVRLPTGERVERVFSVEAPLSHVYDWATCVELLPEGGGRELVLPKHFEFSSSFPQRRFGRDEGEKTLSELGLVPSVALLIIDKEA